MEMEIHIERKLHCSINSSGLYSYVNNQDGLLRPKEVSRKVR